MWNLNTPRQGLQARVEVPADWKNKDDVSQMLN